MDCSSMRIYVEASIGSKSWAKVRAMRQLRLFRWRDNHRAERIQYSRYDTSYVVYILDGIEGTVERKMHKLSNQ
eukprot:4472728-Ditylum_brightwellii.AAC.1